MLVMMDMASSFAHTMTLVCVSPTQWLKRKQIEFFPKGIPKQLPSSDKGPVRGSLCAMCRKVQCKGCGKMTWTGCGQHKESSLRGVPEEQRCGGWKKGVCDVNPEKGKEGGCTVQ